MNVISVLLTILYLFILPMSYGNVLTRDFDKKYRTLGNVLTVGFLYELMIFQAIYLFVYLAKGNFYSISKIATIFMIWFGIGSLFMGFRDFKKITLPKIGIGFFVFVIINILMVVMRNLYGVNDGDDAYVLGNALTTLTNGELYKTDYYTGLAISSKSYLRHLLASNPIFIAYLAKTTMIHPTVLAHRILGSFYIVLHNIIILNVANLLFEKDEEKEYRYLFASLVAFITIWDFHSYLTDSTFILSRAWQGKSMFCSIIIPFSIELFLIIGQQFSKGEFQEIKRKIFGKETDAYFFYTVKKMTTKEVYFLVIPLLCVASVAMTPGAIAMYSIFILILAVWVSIATKKIGVFLRTLIYLTVPMAVLAVLYFKISF